MFFPLYHPVFLKYLILILQQTGNTTLYRTLYPPPPSPLPSLKVEKQMKGNKILVWKVYRLHCPVQHLLWCWYCDVNVKICFEYLDFSLLWPSAVWIWQYFLSWQKKLIFCSMWIHTKVFKPNSYFLLYKGLIWNSVWLQSTGVLDFWQRLPIGVWWALCVTCLGELLPGWINPFIQEMPMQLKCFVTWICLFSFYLPCSLPWASTMSY